MKVLILGSKGFIGTHCIDYFSSKGYTVYGCDVIEDYYTQNYFLVDAVNPDYRSILSKQQIDVVINASGAAHVSESFRKPLRDFELNSGNVYKILDAIKEENPACKYLGLSSAAVYGNPDKLPVSEDEAVKPLSPYGFHKMYAEQMCREFLNFYNIQSSNLRIFSAYGPGLKKQLFWDLYLKCKNSSHIELFGTGKETRDFIFVTDLIRVIELVLKNAPFQGESINVGNGQEITIAWAVQNFIEAYNPSIKFSFNQQTKTGDPNNWEADISKLTAWGYTPDYNFEKGIKEYTLWLKDLG